MLTDEKKHLFAPAILICLLLITTTVVVYLQVKDFAFINLDDPIYILDNRHVKNGLTAENILWAFTGATKGTNYWAPLTWISIILDFELYGMNAGGYHVTNLILHILNTLLLLLVLCKMTGELWKGAFVAALFSLHPLHVESVAWVTERKDMVSAFFWFLTLLSYAFYTKSPGIKNYLFSLFCFLMGLMSKPMLITLPFVLLLLDFWPFKRIQPYGIIPFFKQTISLFKEKIPFFALIPVISIVTYLFQQKGGAIHSLSVIPLAVRMKNIAVAYIHYLCKMIWPFNLSVIYPYPEYLSPLQVISSLFLLLMISLLAIYYSKKAPFVIVGWLWYIGTLVPVIGIVVIGPHSVADRYTYIPLVGIFIIIAYGLPELLKQFKNKKRYLVVSSLILVSCLSLNTWMQAGIWQNSMTVFNHALAVTQNNALAHLNLGNTLMETGDLEGARKHYTASLEIFSDSDEVHNNLGTILMRLGKTDDAIEHYRRALQINPDSAGVLNNLGNALKKAGRTDEAIECFTRGLKTHPDLAELNFNLGLLYSNSGKPDKAIRYFNKALQIDGRFAMAYYSMGNAFMKLKQREKAINYFSKALETNPSLYMAHFNMGQAFEELGRIPEAVEQYRSTLQINPGYATAHSQLAATLLKTGNLDEAAVHFYEALKRKPDSDYDRDSLLMIAFFHTNQKQYDKSIDTVKKIAAIHPQESVYDYSIACLYSISNRKEEAIEWLRKAVDKGYNDFERMKTDRNLENIRQTEAYQEILKQMPQ